VTEVSYANGPISVAMEIDNRRGTVAVVGLGTMGRKIATMCLKNNNTVVILGRTPESGKAALSRIIMDLKRKVEKGKISPDMLTSMTSRIHLASGPKDLKNAFLVVEAVNEDMNVKKQVYQMIEPHMSSRAILATNTSSLPVTELGSALKDPSRFVGLHFFNPPEVMKLVEVRGGVKTSEETTSATIDFAKGLGKTTLLVPDIPGYYVNRMLFPMLIESILVFEASGADPKDIDTAMKLGANHPMGPLELCDYIGNDVVLSICNVLWKTTRDRRFEPPELLRKMVAQGKLGRKTGEGFHKYVK